MISFLLVVPIHTSRWIVSFLTDWRQQVKLGKIASSTWAISIGTPQGFVFSPFLFSLYTNDSICRDLSVKVLKLVDDTTVICLMSLHIDERLNNWACDAAGTVWMSTCLKL